jgi:hypothetical protein
LNQRQTRTVARFLNGFTGNLDDRDPLTTGGFAADHDIILFNSACRELRG